MKDLLKALLAFLLVLPVAAFAQFTLSGTVLESGSSQFLPGASVLLLPPNQKVIASENGAFSFTDLAAGEYTLQIFYVGFQTISKSVQVNGDNKVTFQLEKSAYRTDEVVVLATRANERTGTTYTNVSKEEIEKRNFGQDIPYLLEEIPNVVANSDAGAGIGYTGIRIRGSDITRINVTVNGIPINDPESHGAFFVNMPDLASSMQDIQVQRGVGTSTNGAGAFGASINIKTQDVRREAYAETDNTYGSFNTWRNNVRFGTGLLGGKFAFDGRLSRIISDGYIDRASSNLKSFYFSGGYFGEKTSVKFITFSGQETTYQAWYGTPEALVFGNAKDLQDYIDRNGIEGTDLVNLQTSGRRYNYYTYDNEVDQYQQDHYQLHLAQQFSPAFSFSGAIHYTYGRGYYEQFRKNDKLASYNLPELTIGTETIKRTDIIRRRWLDNDFYGFTYAFNYNPGNRFNATLGGAINRYDGRHFGEVIWARHAGATNIRHRYYNNNADKRDFNIFAKATFGITEKLYAFGDMQVRKISYDLKGIDNDLEDITQKADYTFYNPKAGLTYNLKTTQQLYASFAIGNREPVRDDFTEAAPNSRPKPETLRNVEAGYRGKTIMGTFANRELSLNAELNYFLMDYKNQLVLTGEINDVGGYNRTNIKESYRQGVELAGAFNLGDFITLSSNVAYSKNRIKNFSEFIDDYDTGEQVKNQYSETTIAFSPEVVTTSRLEVEVIKGLRAAFIYKTVGRQYLDNTRNEKRIIPAYQVADVRLRYNIDFKKALKSLELGLLVNNVLNELYAANGYTYSYIYDATQMTENFYYPQATRNYLVSVGLKF